LVQTGDCHVGTFRKSLLTGLNACASDPLSSMHHNNKPAALLAVIAIGLLAAQLAALAMAVSPAFHKWLHHDADEPSHQCVVNAIAFGQIDTSVAMSVTFLPLAFGLSLLASPYGAQRTLFRYYVLEHGPPAEV
jgi:hypothetical protein